MEASAYVWYSVLDAAEMADESAEPELSGGCEREGWVLGKGGWYCRYADSDGGGGISQDLVGRGDC